MGQVGDDEKVCRSDDLAVDQRDCQLAPRISEDLCQEPLRSGAITRRSRDLGGR
jgi:hypothetical protein